MRRKLINLINVLTDLPNIESIALIYHENTKMIREVLSTLVSRSIIKQSSVSEYTLRRKRYALSRKVKLKIDHSYSDDCLKQLISLLEKRKSCREFSTKPISLNKISLLLYYSAGIKSLREYKGIKFYSYMYPSAGALGSLEVYLISIYVDELEPGVYHYNNLDNTLEQITFLRDRELLRASMVNILAMQHEFLDASAFIVITCVLSKILNKYGDRGYRYALLEAGHLMQNVYLLSTALGMGCCAIGGFFDDELSDLLKIDGVTEIPLYVAALGIPKDEYSGHTDDNPEGVER